jgi:hypothetical protein
MIQALLSDAATTTLDTVSSEQQYPPTAQVERRCDFIASQKTNHGIQ